MEEVEEVATVAVGPLESQLWSLLIPRVLGPCCQGAQPPPAGEVKVLLPGSAAQN